MSVIKKIMDNKVFSFFYNLMKSLLIAIITVYVIFIVIQRISGNRSIFGYRVFTVATGSMVPVYKINDIIVVKDVDANSLKIGDDIAYMGEKDDFKGKLVTHRIISKTNDSSGNIVFQTQGLANQIADPSISSKQVYGKVIGKLLIINILNHVIKNQFGFFFLIFVPLVLVIFLEIADTVVEMKLERKELIDVAKKPEEIECLDAEDQGGENINSEKKN